jgi:hypothetical protein
MSALDYDFSDEIAERALVEDAIRGISQDGVRGYFGTYGDAVYKRISNTLAQAEQLKACGWCDSSVVMAVTCIEITIRYLLVHPLIQAAFLSEDWADLLTQRIMASRTADDRKLIPEVLRFHDIDIKHLRLADERELWPTILEMYKVRNAVVHEGASARVETAETAIDCAINLRDQGLLPLAMKHGFTQQNAGQWYRVNHYAVEGAHYNPRSPFK